MKRKKFVAAVLLIAFSILLFPSNIKALDNSNTWESKYTDNSQKVWKVKFNYSISSNIDDNKIKDYVWLQDVYNNKISVDVRIASDRKSLEVSYPYYGYEKNKTYYIIIKDGLESDKGKKLKKTIKIPFEVSDFIVFKDKNLENEIRKVINKPKGGILKEDVINVQSLYLNNKDIESIEGLNYFVNLKNLYISNNRIEDISPLKNLYNLEILNMNSNNINDISSLQNFYSLRELYLNKNKIQNIDSINNFYNITKLDLGSNKISKVSALSNLTNLVYLNLENNYIDDISSLKNLINLKTLYLNKNDITNYSPVAGYYDSLLYKDFTLNYPMSFQDKNFEQIIRREINKPSGDIYYSELAKIKELDLSYANIYYITGIKALTSLEKLTLTGIKATDFSELKYLKNLKELNLDKTVIYELSPLEELKELQKLNLSNTSIDGYDLNYLSNLTKLIELDLSNTNIYSDLDKLKNLELLLKLNLKGTKITDISGLKYCMKNLVYLNIADTNITNSVLLNDTVATFPKLKELDTTNLKLDQEIGLNRKINFSDINFENIVRDIIKKYAGDIYGRDVKDIKELDLKDKNIVDLGGIENFTGLKSLDLSNNKVTNLKPLEVLTNLETLILHHNSIGEISSLASLTNLKNLDLSDNNISNIGDLQNLTALRRLDLSNNLIERINELSGLTNLEYLSLYGNKVGNKQVEAGQPISAADLSPLRYMFNLRELYLGKNELIWDYSYIVPYYEKLQNKDFTIDLDKVVVNFFKENETTNVNGELKGAIKNIVGYKTGYDGNIYYKDVKKITDLDLSGIDIKSIDGIEYFVNLNSLKLNKTNIENLRPLGNLNKLKKLELNDNKIKDLKPLEKLTKLNSLWLSNNLITNNSTTKNLEPLKDLKALTSLKLDGNSAITDITQLKNLTSLTTLYLPSNSIDFSPVREYYYNLTNKNFTFSSGNFVTVEKIEDVFININRNVKYSLPSALKAEMSDSTTRQLEVLWDDYTVDTSTSGTYTYYGTVEGYSRKIKLILNVMEDKVSSRGNSIGNIMNKGIAASDGSWVYYSNLNEGGKLYKESLSSGQNIQLTSDEVSYINVYNGWIYFLSKGDMYRIKNDGSSLTRITSDNANYINIVDGYIYYFDSSKGGIWKIRVDSLDYEDPSNIKATEVKDRYSYPYRYDVFTQIAVDNNYVYFQNLEDGLSLYKMRIDGSEAYSKINTGEVRNINIYGEYLYFTEGGKIYKIRNNGSDKTLITREQGDYINVVNGWIYFRNNSDSGKLYKIKIDGSYLVKLSDDKVRNINVVEGYIYYSNESSGFSLGKIRID